MANWLNKYEQGGLVLKKKTKDNYGKRENPNDVKASVGPDFVGLGYNTKGRNYSPAWGGQFQDGGKLTLPEAIVYGHKDPKVKDYFDKVRTDAEKWRDEYYWNTPTAGYHALEQMHSKYGAPKINTIREKDRAYYNPITDSMNISIPKYGDEYGDPVEDQFLHELAHKVQANKKGNVGFVKDFVGKDLINTLKNVDSSDIFTKKGWLDAYRKNYHTPGTVENEAHSVIAPKLEEEYRDIRSKQYDRLYGDMAMGGALPGAVGFTYARTQEPAPSNGPYAKKTKASAQNGKEMSFYQNGLDFTPKSISKNGSIIKDDRGQWAHPGEVTEIGSNDITMQGVDYPVLGVSDTGDTQMMYPDQDYKFDGEKVVEYPMAQDGGWLDKYQDGGNINKKLKEEAEERLARMKRPKATISQYTPKPGEQAKFDKQKLDRIAEDNAPLNRMAASKGAANMQDAIEAAMIMEGGLAVGKLVAKGIPKATRAGLTAIDRNFSNVGKELAQIEKEGLEMGVSPEWIKRRQLQKVGITSSQREAYVPGVSDALEKYIYPQGYTGIGNSETKFSQTMNAIKTGKRMQATPPREDAWSLYLGKPQKSSTFRIAETAPINHPSYTPEQLSKMDIYSLNDTYLYQDDVYNTLEGVGPHVIDETTIGLPGSQAFRLEQNSKMLTDPISHSYNMPVMGGFNRRLNQYGLEYNDIWDLEPELFGKKIKVDKFIGKPFMSHGVLPNVTPENVKSLLTSQIKNADAELKPMAEFYKDLMNKGSMIDYSKTLAEHEDALNRINKLKGSLGMDQDIMMDTKGWGTKDWNNTINNPNFKKENGGWLNKYK